jgi:prevent-host-death family protein
MKRKPVSSVGSFQAKTHFSSLLNRAANGEVIEITRRGIPVAQLVPAPVGDQRRSIKEIIEELQHFSKGRRLGKLSIRQMIEKGRRY